MSLVTYILVVAFGGFVLLLAAEVAVLALARSVQRSIHRARERRRRARILFLADVAHLVHVQSCSYDSTATWLGSSAPDADAGDSIDSHERMFRDSGIQGRSPASPTRVHTARHLRAGTQAEALESQEALRP